MSVLKIISGEYQNDNALENVYDYIINEDKTDDFVYGYNVIPDIAITMFRTVKSLYDKTDGKQLIHFVFSLSEEEKDRLGINGLYQISMYIASFFRKYQVVFSIHTKQACLHTHFIVNTVSFLDGKRLSLDKRFFDNFKKHCNVLSVKGIYIV